MHQDPPPFTFIDLFAGIGGFHAALAALGGRSVYASEIDPKAAAVYSTNWGQDPLGDITTDANEQVMRVPRHDVLAAGFPCQPFSKSGFQRGMDEARGTLFWNIAKIIEKRRPAVVLLENVRNLAGPRHKHEWGVIIRTLREFGYRVSDEPAVFSPHLLPPELGGRPQVRDRVFIAASYVGEGASLEELRTEPPVRRHPVTDWGADDWNLERHLPLDPEHSVKAGHEYGLSAPERRYIEAWDEFVQVMRRARGNERLPGFPLWADEWRDEAALEIPEGTPDWKADFLRKNAAFYTQHRDLIDTWLERWNRLADFPPSRRKLEWQAQNLGRLWDAVMHFRPSGIRAKRPTYLPALVAITQTSIVGSRERRISPREAARLQGLPEWFSFGDQPDPVTYRQLGNGVNVGVVYYVMRKLVERDKDVLWDQAPYLVRQVLGHDDNPDPGVEALNAQSSRLVVRTRDGHEWWENQSRTGTGDGPADPEPIAASEAEEAPAIQPATMVPA